MRKFHIFLLFLTFISCKAQKDNSTNANNMNLIFEHWFEIDSVGIKSFPGMEEKIYSEEGIAGETDSTGLEKIKVKSLADLIRETPKTKIYIEYKNDSIWRYTTQRDVIIGDIFTLTKNNGNLDYRPKFDKKKIYRTFDLFAEGDKYIVEIDKSKRKKILKYNCYYVKITKIENEDIEFYGQNTMYEMFVTESVKLPVHSLINVTKNFNEFFPLEVKISNDKLNGAFEFYTALEIK